MPQVGGIGLLTAFFAGMVSFLSPCVLPLVPGYLSAITGITPSELERAGWRSVIPASLTFIASFSAIFILLGLTTFGLVQSLHENQTLLNHVAGVLIIVMGLLFIAATFITRLNREWHVDALIERAGSGGPMVAGAAFALAWTPCIGPTLGAILTLAGTTGSAFEGGLMLAVYSAGLGIPFLLTAIAFGRATTAFAFVKRHYTVIIGFGGIVLVVMGILVFTGELTRLNNELLRSLDDAGIDFFSA
ncbi:MAG: cytochrome c biogenesis protein CcdA [Solirubrobacterales bacterium]